MYITDWVIISTFCLAMMILVSVFFFIELDFFQIWKSDVYANFVYLIVLPLKVWNCSMKTTSHGNVFCISSLCGKIPLVLSHKGPVMQSFNVLFDVSLSKLLSNQSSIRWVEMAGHSCDVSGMMIGFFAKKIMSGYVCCQLLHAGSLTYQLIVA